MITAEQYRRIREHNAFKHFSVDQFDQLAQMIQYRRIPKDQILFFDGDKRDKLFLIQSGYVRIEQCDETDTHAYIDYIGNGTLFPYGGLFQDEQYHYTAIAITNLECFYIPVNLYEKLCQINCLQLRYICQKLSSILHFHEIRLRNMVVSSASDRVIQSLGVLLVDLCGVSNEFPFPITALELSRLSGTTRETVSHVLKELTKNGIITYRKKKLIYSK